MKEKNSLINSGIYVLNEIPQQEEKTIIVLGSPRSGTSMMGKILYALNIFRNNQLDKSVFEDREIIDLLENKKDEKEIENYFKTKTKEYKIWGFKRPGAYFYIKKYEKYIINPIYIIPFKDMLSISLRKNISIGQDFKNSLKETMEHHIKLINFILNNDKPMILFSYEKAILNPDFFVESIVKILDIHPSKEELLNAKKAIEMNPESYLQNSRERVIGFFDNLKNNCVLGWAKAINHDKPVDVYVYINNKLVKTAKANIYREDLKKKNIGNGKHGFNIELEVPIKEGDIINIYAGLHKDELNKSPLIYKEKRKK